MSGYPSIRQLQCFRAVAEERNFRRAAERLHMSQPPLSRQIQALEAQLGLALFERSSHHVDLTPAGMQLLGHAQSVLDAYDRLLSDAEALVDADAPAAQGARLRIGLTQVIDPTAWPDFSASLSDLAAPPAIEECHGTSRRLLADVRAGRLDLAFLTAPAEMPDDVTLVPAWQEPLVVALPAEHPAAAQDAPALVQIADRPLFWFRRSENPVLYDRVAAAFAQAGCGMTTRRKPADRQALLNKVAEGQGIALVPRSATAVQRPGIVYRGFSDGAGQQLRLEICLAHRSDARHPHVQAAADRLLAALRNAKPRAAAAA
jgi:DNA-binding transcriptional LysR family regulator